MGVFSKSNSNYNKALEHYYNAKTSIDNHIVFLSELQKAAEYLQEDIRKNRGTADALVVLSNIFYSVFRWDMEENFYPNDAYRAKYFFCAMALMHHWRLGWRGYNKNSNQGQLVIKMLNDSLDAMPHSLDTPEKVKDFWDHTHLLYYSDALSQRIIY